MKREYGRFGFGSFVARAFLALAFLFLAVFSGHAFAEDDEKAYPTMYPPGKCIYVTGISRDYHVTLKNSYDLLIQKNVTVEAWVLSTTDSDDYNYVFRLWKDDCESYGGYLLATPTYYGFSVGRCDAAFADNPRVQYRPGSAFVGQWHHVAATFDGSYLKMYVDGKLVASEFTTKSIGGSGDDTYWFNIGSGFDGYINELRVWKTARSEQEIKANYDSVLFGDEQDLVLYLRFDERKTGDVDGTAVYYFEDLTGNHTLEMGNLPYYETALTGVSHVDSHAPFYRIPSIDSEEMEAPGNALQFDGSDEYVQCGPFDELTPDGATVWSYTKEAWIKLNDTGGVQDIVSSTVASLTETHRLFVDNGTLKAWAGDASFEDTSGAMEAGMWYHVAAVYDKTADEFQLYKNGVLVDQGPPGSQFGPIFLLGSYDDGNYFNGTMEEVRIWSVPRTEQQIMSNMSKILQGNETGLVAYYKFDHSKNPLLADDSSSGEYTALLINMEDEDWVESDAALSEGGVEDGWIYYDKAGNVLGSPTEDQIENLAVKRVNAAMGVTDYALAVLMDHSEGKGDGAPDEFGNPFPEKGKTWYRAGELVSPAVNGLVLETNNINLRYVITEYSISCPSCAGDPVPVVLEDLDESDILALPEVAMDDWVEVEYVWKSQYRVAVSTLPVSGVSDIPVAEVVDGSGQPNLEGSGEEWYFKNTELKFTAADGCLRLVGYRIIDENPVDAKPDDEFTRTIEKDYSVVWEYETPVYEEYAVAGSPVAFITVEPKYRDRLLAKPNKVKSLDDPNEDPAYLYVWKDSESKFIPTVGDKDIHLEFAMEDGACFELLTVTVHVSWPDKPHYTHISGARPVLLDPSSVDGVFFKEMKHSTVQKLDEEGNNTGHAVVSDATEFNATGTGYSSLYFSGTHISSPAPREISLWFDGTDDFVECGEILRETDSYTIAAWIKTDGSGARRDIASGRSRHAFYVENGTLKAAHMNSGGGWNTVSGGVVPDGTWTHVAAAYDGGSNNLRLFVNGASVGSGSADPIETDRFVFLGAFNETGYNFLGQMDEVAIYEQALSSVNPDSPSTSGLIAYYKMDRAGESYLHDASSRRYHATMQNMAPHRDRAHLHFYNSRNNYVRLPSVYSGGDLTLEGWVLMEDRVSDGVFLDLSSGGSYPVVLTLSDGSSGKPKFCTDTGSCIVSEKVLPENAWTHVAATFEDDDGTARIFVNGVQTASGTLDVPATTARPDSYMGGKPSGNSCEAIFDKVRIWNTVRSQAQISANMKGPLTGSEGGLLALYRSEDSIRGSILADSSVNGNDSVRLYNWKYPSSWMVEIDATPPAAEGDEATEYPIVRVVETKTLSFADGNSNRPAVIGRELVSTLHDPDAAPPQLYRSKSRYDTTVYAAGGQIFPVNRQFTEDQEDDMLVIWQKTKDGISWPESPVRYACQWPSDTKRIVIAGRHGSESMDADGNDPDYPDSAGSFQSYFDPARYSEIAVYWQDDPELPGYNPNEEHALIAPSLKFYDRAPRPKAAFALCNDLNIVTQDESYTSAPMVLVHYYDSIMGRYGMEAYKIEIRDLNVGYDFDYPMEAGELLTAPYPVNEVIGAAALISEHIGKPGTTKRCYWEDHKGQAWAVSGDAWFKAAFWYPLAPGFWYDRDPDEDGVVETVGELVPFLWDGTTRITFDALDADNWKGLPKEYAEYEDDSAEPSVTVTPGYPMPVEVTYRTFWPDETPVLKAGETMTFSGGEYRADHPDIDGLPMAVGWAAAQVVYDDLNPSMNRYAIFDYYLVRLDQVLEKRTVALDAMPDDMSPASGRVEYYDGMYYFSDLHAGLHDRIFYDPLLKQLGMQGFLNDKTLGDSTLTASPPSVYILQPNVMTPVERDAILALEGADASFKAAVEELYALTRDPAGFPPEGDYTVGLEFWQNQKGEEFDDCASPIMALGPGLAVMPNGKLLDPDDALFSSFEDGYVTIAENNHPDMGALPVALHIVQVVKDKYRGAIKRVLPDNAFDEKVTLRHTADFGANPEELYFQWWYHEDDGEDYPPPYLSTENPPSVWKLFPLGGGEGGLEIELAGAGKDLLVDNFFFARYRHKDCDPDNSDDCWSDWAGAANSRPPDPTAVPPEDPAETYQAQLCEGWIKRVMQAINPFEARITDFYSSDSPATYTSMIQQAGPRYEGAVAFNPDKDVIENVGLIELYQTVMDRGRDLSIDLTQPASTSGVTSALQLAASRIAGLYALLGNEAYTDSLDPTIGFNTESGEYGSLAPTIFTFMNQVPTLLEEELGLLRGIDEEGARPGYNRLLWNFTNDQGEVAYALSYNISDVDLDGFIDEADGRTLYPQAHGDAWGHYLTALKVYYELLAHPAFNWESRAESFYIEGVVVEVDYLDERKFAEIAAAKAKAGAEILDLTYRSKYTENPDGQWQGYRDTDEARAWGVEEWAQRSFMGAWFDYATACAMLPDVDEEHDGMKKIDRKTVTEIQEIAGQARRIQQKYDEVNTGLNPLGLATSVVPFDINPARLNPAASNQATHFEQVYERAVDAMENARIVFDYASDLKNRIRQVATSTEEFTEQVQEQDRDYRNRLIEIFGTPYEGTIGTGKVYPAGYQGPDYYLYNYIDVNEVSEETVSPATDSFTAFFKPMNRTFVDPSTTTVGDGDLAAQFSYYFEQDIKVGAFTSLPSDDTLEIVFPVASAADYSFQAPEDWGIRKSPGEIQQALIELVKAEADYKMALQDYAGYIGDVTSAIDLLEATSDLHYESIEIGNEAYAKKKVLGATILSLRNAASIAENFIEEDETIQKTTVEGLPKVSGLSNDTTFTTRAVVTASHGIKNAILKTGIHAANIAADGLELEQELADMRFETEIQMAEYKYEIQQQLKELEGLLGGEVTLRLEAFKRNETVRQLGEKYRAVLAKGLRLMEERKAFNARVSAKTQGKRYQDMAFRTSLNDALSMYRQSFDLAARYVYLAAKAYDYETNLSHRDPASAIPLMTDIVKQRTLGEYKDGEFIFGQGGLGDVLTRMSINFQSLKTQMGIDNPQSETGRFSLRYELMRIMDDAEYDDDWRNELRKRMVKDLWVIPEFRKFCRPFAPETYGEQPGLIIEFPTEIMFGKNLFGQNLGGGDHAYDASNFATKVRSVGLWFDGYDNSLLAETPRVYVVPVGMDVMYVPDSEDLDTREWSIVDQLLPTPLPVGDSNLNNPDFIPSLDGLDGSMIEIRRFATLLAYHDAGYMDQSQMNYNSRVVGRSVWNSRWMLIIPGGTFHYDADFGLDTFVDTVKDIKLFFETYAISGA